MEALETREIKGATVRIRVNGTQRGSDRRSQCLSRKPIRTVQEAASPKAGEERREPLQRQGWN